MTANTTPKTVKGNRIEIGMILAGGTEILELGRNGKRHLSATVRRDGVTFTLRINPRETYTLA